MGYIPLGLYTHDPDWPHHPGSPYHFHEETSIGLANGEILIFYYGIGSNYPLYSFDGDEWTKRYVEISAMHDSSTELVQILTIKNYDKDRLV